MERFICVHGHFYQPPRENPSLEAVEIQDSAYPYHDWNERITAQCYAPNGVSRILDGEGRIAKLTNNYSRMSFNFGPTLLSWLADRVPEVYRLVLEADQESSRRFSGHGSALAQGYNHMILPLANERDKRTQVFWGVQDFQHRFGRRPEGMWLPETAVDLATLDHLADEGIRFTILAPYQASRVRRMRDSSWRDVSGGRVDLRRPYAVRLPSGRQIAVFFYDGQIAQELAFGGLLDSGEGFAGRLTAAFAATRSGPQIVHVATDGETYGHHHAHGDMALAYALDHIESGDAARLTNYAEYLDRHPPTHEAEIFENTSWSCAHGIERWRSNCGCNTGGYPNWNQLWRVPLREALDWLRDRLASLFVRAGSSLLQDPWQARDDYILVILDRSPQNVEAFLGRHASRQLAEEERLKAVKLLEMQRQALLMFTSCGWFFDEISGIETVQVLQYAGRAVQLAGEITDEPLEPGFLELLERAKSNIPEHRDGRHIFEKWVKPSLASLGQVGAHYAMTSLFRRYGDSATIYSYTVDRHDYRLLTAGRERLALGKAGIRSVVTGESKCFCFSALHLGDHHLSAGVRVTESDQDYEAAAQAVENAFDGGDIAEIVRVMDAEFAPNIYSLRELFRDEQRWIMNTILESVLRESESVYRQDYEHHAPMMRFLAGLGAPLPKAWYAAAEVVINSSLRRAFQSEEIDVNAAAVLLDEAKMWKVELDGPGLAYVLRQTMERLAVRLRDEPGEAAAVPRLHEVARLARSLPFEVDLWKVQNIYYKLMQAVSEPGRKTGPESQEAAEEWLESFASLGEELGIRVTEMREKKTRSAQALGAVLDEAAVRRRVPSSTYRLQFGPNFTFEDARRLVPYLQELGISDCYASPIFQSSTGAHGYSISDHGRLSEELGGGPAFVALAGELGSRGMGLILDIVPNHMGIVDPSNKWWMDVLENGPSSVYSSWFDIDWHPAKPELQNRVLLPILGDQYGTELEGGKFRLAFEEGAFYIYYYQVKLPVAPRSYALVLGSLVDPLVQSLGEDSEHLRELQSILTAISYLPLQTESDPEKVAERNREKEVIKDRIEALHQASPEIRAELATALQAYNGREGDPGSFDLLDDLLSQQAYRPSFWRVAAEEINYRRFFDINDLAAIRVELPEVFHATHELVLRLLAEERITGLRVDHPDGLCNPRAYFLQLQRSYLLKRSEMLLGPEAGEYDLPGAVSGWLVRHQEWEDGLGLRPVYVVAEKIISEGEFLPADWVVDGTTGYDFLNSANGLFVHSAGRPAFDAIYGRFVGGRMGFRNVANATKKMIMLVSLASEVQSLSHQLDGISEHNRHYRDFTLNTFTFALREVIAALPVYRTYISGPGSVRPEDEDYIERAVAEAKKRNPRTASSVFDFIRDVLLLRRIEEFAEADRQSLVDLVLRFQQVTGPVMAKGVEDTAFYVYNRLSSLNEVGGSPDHFGESVSSFHRKNAVRQERWPHSMLATSTHDSKRSEDVRARIDVLSEIPKEWGAALTRWGRLNASKKTPINGEMAPDPNDEYLLYQTLLGAWPDEDLTPEVLPTFRERIAAYLHKATKEAKVHTSWINPNEQYDAAVRDFVWRVLPDDPRDQFIEEVVALQRRVAYFGRLNSLSQVLLKCTSPGVPDLYQGNELWNYSLVDPDNRRPVDYERRWLILSEIKGWMESESVGALAGELLETAKDGRIKMYLTYRLLGHRREHQELFARGSYGPLQAQGGKRGHVCAFTRTLGSEEVLVVAPVLYAGLLGGVERLPAGPETWSDTWLILPRRHRGRRYRNIFTGEVVTVGEQEGRSGLPMAAVCATFPVALLERETK